MGTQGAKLRKLILISLLFFPGVLVHALGGGDGIRIANWPGDDSHSYVALSTTGATTSATEQMQFFNQNVQGVRVQNLKQYVIPVGAKFIVEAFTFSIRATVLTITWCRVTLRHSLTGGTSPNSYVIYSDELSLIGTINSISTARASFPGGIPIIGDGVQDIGISAVCTGAPLLDYTIVGSQ